MTPHEIGDARADKLTGRFWPTDKQRPGETVFEWCRRLDIQPAEPQRVECSR